MSKGRELFLDRSASLSGSASSDEGSESEHSSDRDFIDDEIVILPTKHVNPYDRIRSGNGVDVNPYVEPVPYWVSDESAAADSAGAAAAGRSGYVARDRRGLVRHALRGAGGEAAYPAGAGRDDIWTPPRDDERGWFPNAGGSSYEDGSTELGDPSLPDIRSSHDGDVPCLVHRPGVAGAAFDQSDRFALEDCFRASDLGMVPGEVPYYRRVPGPGDLARGPGGGAVELSRLPAACLLSSGSGHRVRDTEGSVEVGACELGSTLEFVPESPLSRGYDSGNGGADADQCGHGAITGPGFRTDDLRPLLATMVVGDRQVTVSNHSYWTQPVNGEPRKKFSVQCSWFLITVSQCQVNHVHVFDQITASDAVKRVVVSNEYHHETDGVHIHAFVEFHTRRNVQDGQKCYAPWFGFNSQKLQPYQLSFSIPKKGDGQSMDQAIRYVIKDGNWIANFNANEVVKSVERDGQMPDAKRSKVWVQILDKLKTGKDHVALLYDPDLGPTVARELQKVQAVQSCIVSKEDSEMRARWPTTVEHPLFAGFTALLSQNGPYIRYGPDGYGAARAIIQWIVRNLQPRKSGQPQLVIAGPTSNQKSALVTAISRWITVAWWNKAENRNDTAYQLIDEQAHLLCVDEYDKDSIPGTQLLRILADTSQVQFRRFHQAGLVTSFALPVILLTNKMMRNELVPDGFSAEQADAYYRRIEFVSIPMYVGRSPTQDFLLPIVQWIEYCGRSYNRVRRHAMNVPFPYVCPTCCSGIELPPSLDTAEPPAVTFELSVPAITFE